MKEIEMNDDSDQNSEIPYKKSSLPFIEKYRPSTISEIISHEAIFSTISNFISKKSIPHFLFYGPPGTGKTTCALALARQLYGESYKNMILELNASDDRGIQIVRNKIKDFCSSLISFNNMTNDNTNNNLNMFKLVILDEADMITSDAQNSLRRIMEKFTKNSRFCLICNQVNKINIAIQSRCMRFRFPPLNKNQCIMRLKYICDKENIKYGNDNTLLTIIDIGKGDMRKTLNLLEATFMASNNSIIDENSVYSCAGLPTPNQFKEFCDFCKRDNYSNVFHKLNDMRIQNGFVMDDLIELLTNFIRLNDVINDYEKVEIFLLLGKMDFLCKIGGNEKIILSNFISIVRKYNLNI